MHVNEPRPRDLDAISERVALEFMRRQSRVFMECAEGSMLQVYSVREVVQHLRERAAILEEFER